MRVRRMIAAGTMAMGAYRAYRQFRGEGHGSSAGRSQARGRSTSRGMRGRQQSQRGGMFGSMLNRH